jgi:hypothetical protein
VYRCQLKTTVIRIFDGAGTMNATKEQIQAVAQEIYRDYPLLLDVAKKMIEGN